ncbi:MAG TPA: hypothetical protein VGV69_03465, partial [Solirubrobacterales bacterium]|nr:hypothetical protein [Solirubrobacterales bacterium]
MATAKKGSGGGRKKAPAKRSSSAKKAPKKASRKTAKKAVKKAEKRSGTTPSGPRLNAAKQAMRDTLIVARKHQEWPWESIAAEAGISVSATKKAYYARLKA